MGALNSLPLWAQHITAALAVVGFMAISFVSLFAAWFWSELLKDEWRAAAWKREQEESWRVGMTRAHCREQAEARAE